MKFFLAFVFVFIVSVAPTPVLADDYAAGTVSQVYLVAGLGAAPGNADLRVYLTGNPRLCSGSVTDPNWAFLNSNDPNYKGILALILMAQTTGKSVTLVTRPMPLAGGTYCQIVVAYTT